MYVDHIEIQTPPDDVRIWRYMNLSQFLYLLHEQSLYFAQTHELNDPWEGVAPAGLANQITKARMKGAFDMMATIAVVNCWHMNTFESVAMWHLYTTGTDGVAIRSTIGALKKAIERDRHGTLIGRVIYSDFDESTRTDDRVPNNMLVPLFHKRKSYEHESEVRAVIPVPAVTLPTEEEKQQTKNISYPMPLSKQGNAIKVDLVSLIDKIVLSPKFPAWAAPALQEKVRQAGLDMLVEFSDLLKEPEPNMFRARAQAKR